MEVARKDVHDPGSGFREPGVHHVESGTPLQRAHELGYVPEVLGAREVVGAEHDAHFGVSEIR